MLLLIGLAQAMTVEEVALSYADAGFDPGAVDEAARGGGMLTAGPGGRLALYNPIDGRVLLIDEGLRVVAEFDAVGVGSMAWDAAGRLVLYDHHRRTLSLYTARGALLSQSSLPDIVPPGGTVAVSAADVFIADVFGNFHRAARISSDALAAPQGRTLVEGAGRVRWSAEDGVMIADGVDWPLPDALKASGRLVGEDWLLVDQIVAESPLQATRDAILLETGESVALPVEERRYVPRADVTVDEDGRLLYLDPRLESLTIVRVTP